MKGRAQPGEGRPLRHCFQVVDRLGRLDLDNAEQSLAALALQHEIGIPGRWSAHRSGLFIARVDRDFEFSFIFRLEQANDAVVLELLSDRPHEDWAHTTSDACAQRDDPEGIRRPKGLNIA